METQHNISFGPNETERHEDLKRLLRYYLSGEYEYEYGIYDRIEEESLLRELESKELDINYLEISNNDANCIETVRWQVINIISLMTNIETLDLSYNLILDEEEYYSLSEAFDKFTNLTSINLSCCSIKYGTEIFENLINCTELIHLDLSINSIRSGVESLAKAEFKKLKYINLSYNEIELSGVKSLVEVLRLNESLTHVYFNNNKFGPKGVKNLEEVLGELKVLTFFDLSDNDIVS
jgi:Leucine-rich repeat (LRR) protein